MARDLVVDVGVSNDDDATYYFKQLVELLRRRASRRHLDVIAPFEKALLREAVLSPGNALAAIRRR